MLVGTGLKADIAALGTLEPRNRVGRDRLIGVTDVRRAVRIADGCGDVEGFGHAWSGPSGARLGLQESGTGDLGKEAADLEYGRGRVEREPRRNRGQLARLGVSVEGPFARSTFELSGLPRDEGRREIEEGGIAFSRAFLAKFQRQVGTARIRRIALPEDRQCRIFELR